MNYHNFYPRCYDLTDEVEFEDFIEEFKFTYAEGFLKKLKDNMENIELFLKSEIEWY